MKKQDKKDRGHDEVMAEVFDSDPNTRSNLLRKFCVTAKMERLKFCVGSSQ